MAKSTKSMAFKSRDPDRTRRRILAEATRLFAKGGYAGTSTNEVVDACGVSKRMLFHYFGDKDGLYRALVLQQWVELKEGFDESARAYMSEHGSLPCDPAAVLGE